MMRASSPGGGADPAVALTKARGRLEIARDAYAEAEALWMRSVADTLLRGAVAEAVAEVARLRPLLEKGFASRWDAAYPAWPWRTWANHPTTWANHRLPDGADHWRGQTLRTGDGWTFTEPAPARGTTVCALLTWQGPGRPGVLGWGLATRNFRSAVKGHMADHGLVETGWAAWPLEPAEARRRARLARATPVAQWKEVGLL